MKTIQVKQKLLFQLLDKSVANLLQAKKVLLYSFNKSARVLCKIIDSVVTYTLQLNKKGK